MTREHYRIFIPLLILAALVSASVSWPQRVADAAGACGLAAPAFCDTFDTPHPITNRSGQLDGVVWGVSRLTGQTNLGQNMYNATMPTELVGCNGTTTVQPGTGDVIVCNGQLREAVNDNTVVTALAMYPKQPFDFAGRTGTVTFDVSNDEPGVHTDWPEFWMSDQPVPVPFTHFNGMLSVPRNGFGIRFAGGNFQNRAGCWTADSAIVVRNYVPDGSQGPGEVPQPGAVTLQPLDCVTNSDQMAGTMNHVEIQVSQSQLDVYATDAGTVAPLKHIATVPNVNLSFTRGLIWIEDAHYNSSKFGGHEQHTFAWDNVGFDGPVIARDLTFDVPDNNQPVGSTYPGMVNLAWPLAAGSGPTLSIPWVNGIQNASAALLTFTAWQDNGEPSWLTYTVNGHSHTLTPPGPPGLVANGGFAPLTYAVPVPLSEVIAGTNNVSVFTNLAGAIGNVDLILVGAGGVSGVATPTDTPVPNVTLTGTPTDTPVATATAQPTNTLLSTPTATLPPVATDTPVPATRTPIPTDTTGLPAPGVTIQPTATSVPEATSIPDATNTPQSEATATTAPESTPQPTATTQPTTPVTNTPAPTDVPAATRTPEPTSATAATDTPAPPPTPTPCKPGRVNPNAATPHCTIKS